MRTKNSIRNIVASTSASIITIIIGLIAQKVFINNLGIEYLGINGLFTNIISMLGIVELGIGLAIIYSLYKPLAHNDISTIKSLMRFYKQSYRIVALIVAAIGFSIMPFLGLVIGDVSIRENIYLIYLLFLLDVILSYLLAYKRSILYADQKNYIINGVHTAYIVTVNILQMLVLILTANFILYLVVKVSMRVLENIMLNIIANKRYPFLNEKNIAPLDSKIKQDIFTKIKALFLHKIGAFVVVGSDNIIISTFLGVVVVGLYANYLLIITAVSMLVSQVFSAITASVGNLLVIDAPDKSYQVYRRIRFLNFWLATVASISLLVCMDSFVKIWIGEQFVLPIGVLIALGINLYLGLLRSTLNSFKEAAAIFHEDRYVPVLEAIINIACAITLLHFFGLAGVFMGTICSTLLLHLYSYPRYVYTRLFKRSYYSYYLEFSTHFLIALTIGLGTFLLSRLVIIENSFSQLLINILVCLTVPNLAFYALYRNSDEFKYYRLLISKIVNRMTQR